MSSEHALKSLLPQDLPDGRALLDEGHRLGQDVKVGLSLLCEQHGVRSEVEYKRKMVEEGRLVAIAVGEESCRPPHESIVTCQHCPY